MSTTTPTQPEPGSHEESERSTLDGESRQFLFENNTSITVRSLHPLFDISVMESFDAFLEELYNLDADKTYSNDYDGIDVLCFKAETAIGNVLTIESFEERSIQHTTRKMNELGSMPDFSSFAARWFEYFLNKYNELLHEETPDAYTTLYTAAMELDDNDGCDPETILKSIADPLGVEVDVTS